MEAKHSTRAERNLTRPATRGLHPLGGSLPCLRLISRRRSREDHAMTPDSPDTRLRDLERDVSALKQQAKDLADDVRSFAPLVAGQAETRATLAHFGTDLVAIQRQLANLELRIEEETRQRKEEAERDRRDRERGQAEREKENRTNKTLLQVAAVSFVGTFLLAISGIVAVLVG